MNEYDELVNWLQNEHNEVFHQWAQIEEVMRLEAEQREKAETKARFERAREQWEEKKTKMQAFLDSNELNEDIKKVVQLNLDMGGKESDGKFYEPYYAWESIRSVMRNQPNNPIRVGGTI
tara:strand:- start:568 stop:927 length:360 start_codon:yes stop_codon:yes gene_type:complete